MPSIDRIHEYENGDLLIGGAFSDFMGQERYSLVQLKLGTFSTNEGVPRIDFQIYPNPAQNKVSLSETGILSIMDITGQQVLEAIYESANTPVDVSFLPAGLYLVSLETQDGIGIKKLVKR
jgi:hypothetical protein